MPTFQIILSALLAVCVLAGISMMSKVQTAVRGNLLSALAMLVGVVATLLSGRVSERTGPAQLLGPGLLYAGEPAHPLRRAL